MTGVSKTSQPGRPNCRRRFGLDAGIRSNLFRRILVTELMVLALGFLLAFKALPGGTSGATVFELGFSWDCSRS